MCLEMTGHTLHGKRKAATSNLLFSAESEDLGENYIALLKNKAEMRAILLQGLNARNIREIIGLLKCVYAIAFVNAIWERSLEAW